MENYQEDLEALIELKKKKKEPNKAEKAEFASAWEGLVREEGFSGNAEKFLYEGFSYCGAAPFRDYMKEQPNPSQVLNEIYKGSLYGKNCAGTASLLLNLLSLWLNEERADLAVDISLISHIPGSMVNKKKELCGQAPVILKKHFINELNAEVQLPDISLLKSQGLSQNSLESFTYAIDETVRKIEPSGLGKEAIEKLHLISSWLHPDGVVPVQADHTDSINGTGKRGKTVKKGKQNEELKELRRKISDLSARNFQSSLEVEALNNENSNLKKTVENNVMELKEKTDSVARLSHEKRDLTNRVDSLEKERKELQDKLDKSMEMLEMLRRDRQKQTDENMRKVSSKLKEYYQDYQDAKNLDMSPDLGENLRDQLGDVLDILSEAGIFIK